MTLTYFLEIRKPMSEMTFAEDLKNKFYYLYNSKNPSQVITSCANRCWEGTKHLKPEEMLLPLGMGVVSGITTVQFGKAALDRFRSCKFISALFYSAVTGLSAYATVYNFNHLANITYQAGGDQNNWFNFS